MKYMNSHCQWHKIFVVTSESNNAACAGFHKERGLETSFKVEGPSHCGRI